MYYEENGNVAEWEHNSDYEKQNTALRGAQFRVNQIILSFLRGD